ncbi:hypothetical protein NP233_g2650 [Leucocoprinus birnbaumii]|uniref:NACHT domain-containing protein n=1 Tax=Leucocoprinus birnbaumii TaxID=56174 RepID=A0AAD5W1U2_9AGAR|nr:hypothetical protein NP233_g2650 [Leucocoprinus birnbaumii]
MFDKAKHFQINGGTFNDYSGRGGIDRLFDFTNASATYDSYVLESKASCLEGTRTRLIEDITTWTTGLSSQSQPKRLLWMHGPAGVGKSAVAKSCAEKTASYGLLGASFFFSRDNGVNDPTYFFTTIAYQLATKIPSYRDILGAKLAHDATLLGKGLDVQFHELIAGPILALRSQSLPLLAIFVDGLDECNSDKAQSRIVELIASSVAATGDRIPLLWAFFSRPEQHIERAFARISHFPGFWKVNLPVSHDYDNDIRLYMRSALYLPVRSSSATASSTWPSEEDLDALVNMVAGLFIYAAAVVKFIMDPDALSPQRQLQDVLRFGFQQGYRNLGQSWVEPGQSVVAGLDAFYSMLMSRIPKNLLPITQQILLINYSTTQSAMNPGDADFLGELTRRPPDPLPRDYPGSYPRRGDDSTIWERSWNSEKPWPGSARIVFYHASFMEFLLDRERSGDYWIEDKCHYDVLASDGLSLWEAMYVMNGLEVDQKIERSRELLSVFPDRTFSSSDVMRFRNEIFYHCLCGYALTWCARSSFDVEVEGDLRNIAKLAELGNYFNIEDRDWESFRDKNLSYLRFREPHPNLNELEPLLALYPTLKMPAIVVSSDAPTSLSDKWSSIAQMTCFGRELFLYGIIRDVYKDADGPAFLHSQISHYSSLCVQKALERAKQGNLESMDELQLLDYYSEEWGDYTLGLNSYIVKPTKRSDHPLNDIKQAVAVPWQEFFLLIEGESHKLTRAANNFLLQFRNGNFVPRRTLNLSTIRLLGAFADSLSFLSSSKCSASTSIEHTRAELLRATEEYYSTEKCFRPEDTFRCNLARVADRVREEGASHGRLAYPPLSWSNEVVQVSVEIMMMDHWEDLYDHFEEILLTMSDADNSRDDIFRIIQYSSTVIAQLIARCKAHVKESTSAAVAKLKSSPSTDALAPVLLGVKEQQMKKMEWICPRRLWRRRMFHDYVTEAFDEIFAEHPEWHDAVKLYVANQENQASRPQPDTQEESPLIDDVPPLDIKTPQGIPPSSVGSPSMLDNLTPDLSRGPADVGDNIVQLSHPPARPNPASHPVPIDEAQRLKKNKFAQFFRRHFKHRE